MSSFKFESLSQQKDLIHGVSTATYGNMSYIYGDRTEVQANRRKFFEDLDVPEKQVAVASLVHGRSVVDVTDADRGRGIATPDDLLEGDILATNKPDTYLFFVVADCLALLLFDPVKQVCALAHAGWRGVDQEVPKIAVEHLATKYGSNPDDVLVGMSPSLGKESACFEQLEQNQLPKWHPYVIKRTGDYCVDIRQFAYDQLIKAGIKPEHIEKSTIDTRLDPNFFSHRRSAEENLPEKRFGALIGLKVT